MLEILTKKEALNRYMAGEAVYTTVNFVRFRKIETLSLEDIREEKDWDGDHMFFIQQTKIKAFKTQNNSFLNMKRITWEELRDVCLNCCNGLEIPKKFFLLENTRKTIDDIFGIVRIMDTQVPKMTFESLKRYSQDYNIYKYKIK